MLFPPSNPRWFVVGVNYPSIAESGWTGNSLGPNQIMGWNRNRVNDRTLDTLSDDFRRMKNFGADVVRMFAFKNGQGLRWQEGTQPWIVNGLDEDFERNVVAITARAEEEHMKIYWTLFDYSDFTPGITGDSDDRLRMKVSMRNIMTDPTGHYRDSFIENALRNFIDAVDAYSDGVFAIDLMNEPDTHWHESIMGDLRNIYNRRLISPIIRLYLQHLARDPRFNPNPDLFIDLLCQLANFIRDHTQGNILVSTGFCRFSSIPLYHSIFDPYFDFYDFHHYHHLDVSNTGFLSVPSWDSLEIDKPCIIGECGLGGHFQRDIGRTFSQACGNEFARTYTHASPVPLTRYVYLRELFLAQRDCIRNVMNGSYAQGYAGCMVWEYGKQYTDLSNSYCPYNPKTLYDRADWADRYFLLWKPNQTSTAIPPEYRIALDPPDPDGLVGRPVVQSISDFAGFLTGYGLRPQW
jgi:hypothetical protein